MCAIALVRLWALPTLGIWWAALGALLFKFWASFALKNSLEMYGADSGTTKAIGVVRTTTDFFLIALGVYSLLF